MFWKRKKNKPKVLFEYEETDRRHAFRVSPAANAPINLLIADQRHTVLDISAVGLAFANSGFQSHTRHHISFNLPDQPAPLEAELEIVFIDSAKICHCKFCHPDPSLTEALHKYVLQRQKQMLRHSKKKAARPPDRPDRNETLTEEDFNFFF